MMRRPTTAGDTALKFVIVTLDSHLASAIDRAVSDLASDLPGLKLVLHAAAEWAEDPEALQRCLADIADADIIVATMLFMDDHIQAVLPALKARRDSCDAIIGCLSAEEVVKVTRMGGFRMDKADSGIVALLKRLRGSSKKTGDCRASGAKQMAMLRRLPKILRFIPGSAQDVRAYFLTLQYWLAGSDDNVGNMVRFLIDRYADGSRRGLRGTVRSRAPTEYPDVGLYHPALADRVTVDAHALPRQSQRKGRVGLLVMRSYVLAGNTRHYDGVIAALEAQGLDVVPAFSAGLDARPAIENYFRRDGVTTIDALVSLTGFSLVGGPAYNDAAAAAETLSALDVPYLAAHAIEFQTLEQWGGSDRGLMPVEATIMVAIPEIDGATNPIVFGGRVDGAGRACQGCNRGCVFDSGPDRNMHGCPDRAEMLAARVAKLVTLRRRTRAERKIAAVIFNFPPNAGSTGTAAFLSVFESLFNTMSAMKDAGYRVDVPADVDALRARVLEGNSYEKGTVANVAASVSTDTHVRRQRWLKEIETQWGSAPGKHQTDGRQIHVLGAMFGNLFVGVQPAFGYEGDPMRLLFEKNFAPTHAFAAFYRYIAQDFGADAVLHFGTHGALEFMPGKQAGLSGRDWPDRLIGDLPNIYLYAANNPSEGTIAKRRSAATLVSYLTPPIANAGLYRGLVDLKATLERYRGLAPEQAEERADIAQLLQAQASGLDLAPAEPMWEMAELDGQAQALWDRILELEYTLIPNGMHVVGKAMSEAERADLLTAAAEATHGIALPRDAADAIARGMKPEQVVRLSAGTSALALKTAQDLAETNRLLSEDTEIAALLRALDGRFVPPAPSGDLIRTPTILPTGRNLHGFDPFKIPSAYALADGARQAQRLIERHMADGHGLPQSVALVLWGTDNLKTEGGPIAQALALMGAAPRFDGYGRLCGAELVPLETLGRPRIDVVVTLSGIFRDLLPLQTKLLAEAAYLAATADEPVEWNFVRRHTLAHCAETGADMETAALRVFSNADGAYGSNVNQLVEAGSWSEEDELAETFSRRKSFAYGRAGKPAAQSALMQNLLRDVELTYQNLESVEVGITTIDHYFDTLGGISRAVKRASGETVPVYVGDQTRGSGLVRTLAEQVALETRTRTLNPKWYEGMLKHGHEGVRSIEASVTNTLGWSATTGQVAPWVYQQITQTFVLDPDMRERLAALNPHASARVANRLLEAHERSYWRPDPEVLEALRRAGEDLEDRIEGLGEARLGVEAAA
ncbi:MAG: magnesium chelatase subunit H [Hyphomicrobium sp.]|nr:magnesium chelatase subunit H [Hyphomicrobium sp.]